MILFLDTEWADAPARELVSLALVSDCGRFEFYAERDPLPARPTDFVGSVVYPLLERNRALPDAQFTAKLHEFFESALETANYGKVLIAFDHPNDLDLMCYALDGFESPHTPPRPPYKAFHLGLLGVAYDQAVEDCFSRDPALAARRHHALIDVRVSREAFLRVQAVQLYREVGPQISENNEEVAALGVKVFRHIRKFDPQLSSLLVDVFGDEHKAARWCISHSRPLGAVPIEALSAGRRGDVMQELLGIRHGIM